MFSEELNGKNPEEMEQLQIAETAEQEEPVVETEVSEAEAPAAEEVQEEAVEEVQEEAAEEAAQKEEQPVQEQEEKRPCPICVIKEKCAAVAEKLRSLIPAKKKTEETPVEETSVEGTTEEAAVEETAIETAVEESAVEETAIETAVEESAVEETCEKVQETETETSMVEKETRRRPADAFAMEGAVAEKAEEESEVEEKIIRKPADVFDMEETAEKSAETEANVENAELAEDLLLADEEEPAPAPKKLKPLHLGLAIVGGVVLLAVLVGLILHALGVNLKPRANDLFYKDVYTAEEQQLAKKADDVVATLSDEELTVSELQLYYIDSIYAFYSQNYYYLDFMGLDLSTPLSEQECSLDQSMTWEQYFLDAAIKSWQSYVLVELMAEEDGFVVSAEVQQQIDSMGDQLESIAVSYGYENASAYLSEEMAPGVSTETYLHYNEVFHVSYEYLNTFYEEDYPSETEIHNFYELNKLTFQDNGITPNMGLISDVRHILIQPMGGALSEDGLETVYSEDEWNTALSEAERILEAWKAGEATEDSFATMANTYSEDGGSNTIGGLYENVDPFSNYVPEFLNWAIDSARQVGDTEIVKTSYGYHIMYFVGGQDYFSYVVGEQLITDRIQTRLAGLQKANPIDINYKKVVLCEPVM